MDHLGLNEIVGTCVLFLINWPHQVLLKQGWERNIQGSIYRMPSHKDYHMCWVNLGDEQLHSFMWTMNSGSFVFRQDFMLYVTFLVATAKSGLKKNGISIPWGSKDHKINSLLEKTIILVGIYNQQFQGTIFLMVFDFQGIPKNLGMS